MRAIGAARDVNPVLTRLLQFLDKRTMEILTTRDNIVKTSSSTVLISIKSSWVPPLIGVCFRNLRYLYGIFIINKGDSLAFHLFLRKSGLILVVWLFVSRMEQFIQRGVIQSCAKIN